MMGYGAAFAMTALLHALLVGVWMVFLGAAAIGVMTWCAAAGLAQLSAPAHRHLKARHARRQARRGIRQIERYLADQAPHR